MMLNTLHVFTQQNGTRQHYHLGRLIKQRYTVEHQLLSSNYTRDEVYIRSTDFDRTLMSVLSQLSGLFPPDEDRVYNMFVYMCDSYHAQTYLIDL